MKATLLIAASLVGTTVSRADDAKPEPAKTETKKPAKTPESTSMADLERKARQRSDLPYDPFPSKQDLQRLGEFGRQSKAGQDFATQMAENNKKMEDFNKYYAQTRTSRSSISQEGVLIALVFCGGCLLIGAIGGAVSSLFSPRKPTPPTNPFE